jgi:alanyl-tRNA synthetase
MTSSDIRQSFLDFFRSKGHEIVPSAPVIPHGDKTLLFTNAGMNQFKDVFLGEGTRPYSRAADTQKCIRVSGKHNDLEEVGHDTYHHTLFEMLGNWSFGDYYKKEAIGWAWELLTEVWKLDKSRLYATVFEEDLEAEELWKSETDIDPTHIIRSGAKDNFWEMGDTGPCGPCSEIHYDSTPDGSGKELVNMGSPRVIEVWNLVFIQYNRNVDGSLTPLPKTHVDTGMGFERICATLQDVDSNYKTDVFRPYFDWIQARYPLFAMAYEEEPAFEEQLIAGRVIADHIRTLVCAIADGALPGNDGRGYVLRRILRRAARYGRKLDFREPFLFDLAEVVRSTMGAAFPEINEQIKHVRKVIKAEEESFNRTLDRGLSLFEDEAIRAKQHPNLSISGDAAFRLYDTFGFPIDLTQVLAKEKGLSVDMPGFDTLLEQQRSRSRKDREGKTGDVTVKVSAASLQIGAVNPRIIKSTEFVGYTDEPYLEATRIISLKNDSLIVEQTPFYAESGGQVADTGTILIHEPNENARQYIVRDVRKNGEFFEHKLEFIGDLKPVEGDYYGLNAEQLAVDRPRRLDIMRNHTATHLMHSALRKVLGEHVHQAGSLVTPDKLRFDFNHYEKLSPEQVREIESIVNDKIRESIRLVHHRNIPFEEAKKMGALMFFGDKYGTHVNVVDFGPFSREFCGGTHVPTTAEIGLFKLTMESSIASGVRRVEAVTGKGIEHWLLEQESKFTELSREFETVQEEKRKLEKELTKLKLEGRRSEMKALAAQAKPLNGSNVSIVTKELSVFDAEELKSLAEMLREEMKSGTVGVIGAKLAEDKVSLISIVTDDLIKEKKLQAGKLVTQIAEFVGGKGGGRPQIAQAGGKYPERLSEALSKVAEIVQAAL